MIDRGRLHPFTLRYLDEDLEKHFQESEGAGGKVGLRINSGASAVLWVLAAFLIPLGTSIPTQTSLSTAGLMALASAVCFAATPWAKTLNRQHGLVAVLTAGNGLVILALASAGGALRGYAVAAIMVLFSYAFFSRTRFVFAAMRTVIIAIGFVISVRPIRVRAR